jgi:MFS family permease
VSSSEQRKSRLGSPFTALALGVLSLILFAATLVVADVSDSLSSSSNIANNVSWGVFVLAFTAVGVVVARRQPRNPMGWLLIGVVLSLEAENVGSNYASYDYYSHHGNLPLGAVAAVLSPSYVYAFALVPLVIVLFPDGRPGSSWRWPLRLYIAISALACGGTLGIAIASLSLRLPVNASGAVVGLITHHAWFRAVTFVFWPSVIGLLLSAVVYQTRRYRRATGERRQQLKSLAAGAAALVVCFTLLFASGGSSHVVGSVAFAVGLAALPISMGVGILRYRLYEIDRLISRTLSYALLTGLLVGTFIGLVALTTDTLDLSGRVGVAASTLVAAALFNPLRIRIQRFVDRRFNRARYDAEATVAAFTARLRDAVEIDSIRTDLLDAVNRAVQPTHAAVWIKP